MLHGPKKQKPWKGPLELTSTIVGYIGVALRHRNVRTRLLCGKFAAERLLVDKFLRGTKHGTKHVSFIAGFQHFPRYFDSDAQVRLLSDVRSAIAVAPLYAPAMPRTGKLLSVRMTNCGDLGWLTDKTGGYRYQQTHPETGRAWPRIPDALMALWRDLAHFPAPPEACLINYYTGTAKLGSHRDEDEAEQAAPVVSVSLGDSAQFHVGGLKRGDAKARLILKSGDVVVLGGAARMAYHGIDRIYAGSSDLLREGGLGEGGRINLTLRRVTKYDQGPARH